MTDRFAAERAGARFILCLALLIMAFALTWFAWVDAVITDAAMDAVELAGLAGALAAITALGAWSMTLRSPELPLVAPEPTPEVASASTLVSDTPVARHARRIARLRRIAVVALAAQILIMIFACTVTLNLRGAGDEDASDQQTAI